MALDTRMTGSKPTTADVSPTDVRVGGRYRCQFDDCCIAGEFEASVTSLDADDEFLYAVEFDNGVRLTETLALRFKALDGDV